MGDIHITEHLGDLQNTEHVGDLQLTVRLTARTYSQCAEGHPHIHSVL